MLLLLRVLSWSYWNRHRGALLLSSLGVVLGVAVFVAIQVANHSVFAAFDRSLDAVSGSATLQIQGSDNGIPDGVFTRVKQLHDPRIKAAAPLVSRTFFSPTLKTSVLFLGVDLFSEAEFRAYDLSNVPSENSNDRRGIIEFLTDPAAVAISQNMAARHKLREGSTLEVFIGAQKRRFRVSALLRGQEFQSAYGGDFALLDIATAQETFGQIGKLSRIDLLVEENDIAPVTRVLREIAPPAARVERPAQRGQEVSAMLSAFRLNLTALSCITLFVGAFLIYNAMASAVVRRREEVGTLRAIGASRAQLQQMFLSEAAVLGLVSSIVGLLAGILLSRLALGAVSTTVSSLYVAVKAREIAVPLWLIIGAPLGGTLLCVLSAWPSALEAARTSPRAAGQEATLHQTTLRWTLPLALIGVLLLLSAALLCHPQVSARSALFGFASAFCTLAGFALLAPLSTLALTKLARPAVAALFGIEGVLAVSQLQRALNRSSLVIASLMVALAMTVGLGVMVRSFRASVEDWVKTTIRGDLYIAGATGFSGDSASGLPPEVVRFCRDHPSVRVSDSIRGVETTIVSRITGKPQPVYIAANELPALATGDRSIRFLETASGEAAARRTHLDATGVLVSERFKNLVGLGAGQSVDIQTPQGVRPFFIAGVFYDYTPNQAVVYLPRSLYRKLWNDNAVDALALHLKPEYSVSALRQEIERNFGARYTLTLLSNAQIRDNVFTTFDNTFRVTYALQLIAVMVAAIGIFEALWALILERRRELATLRAVGASARQITKATSIEFMLIGIFGWVLGTLAGLLLAAQLIFVINRQFFGWTIGWTLPISVLLQALGLALLASLGAGIIPSLRAARYNIAENLMRE